MYYISQNPSNQILPVNVTLTNIEANKNSRIVAFPHHFHDSLELLAVKQGTLNVTLNRSDEYTLKSGDIILANPFTMHFGEVMSGNAAQYYGFTLQLHSVHVNNGSLKQTGLFDALNNKTEFKAEIGTNPKLFSLFEDIFLSLRDSSLKSELHITACVYEIMAELLDKYSVDCSVRSAGKSTSFMRDVSAYLSSNYTSDISTADIAAAFFCNTPYFCRKFRKSFGESFSNYLCTYRITKATELYADSGLSITEIASGVGFSDYSYFSRSFKKIMGIPPSKFFKRK